MKHYKKRVKTDARKLKEKINKKKKKRQQRNEKRIQYNRENNITCLYFYHKNIFFVAKRVNFLKFVALYHPSTLLTQPCYTIFLISLNE